MAYPRKRMIFCPNCQLGMSVLEKELLDLPYQTTCLSLHCGVSYGKCHFLSHAWYSATEQCPQCKQASSLPKHVPSQYYNNPNLHCTYCDSKCSFTLTPGSQVVRITCHKCKIITINPEVA